MAKTVSDRSGGPLSVHAAAERVAWVDAAKGLCIILVVMMHSTLGLGATVGREGWLHVLVEFAQPFRIPAFFLIAGLFLSRTIDAPWRRYLDRKVLHFIYFYLLWMLIQSAVKTLPAEGGEDFLRESALALIEPFGTLWFIYLLPVFFVVTKLARRAPVWIVLAEAVALNLWPHETGWTAIDEFMKRYVFFFAGYAFAPYVFRLAEQARRTPDIAIAATGAAFALIAAALFGFGAGAAHASIVALPLAAIGAAGLIVVASLASDTRAGRMLRACGEQSIVIYLAFFLPMAATRMLLVQSGAVGSILDVGTASVIITVLAVTTPLILRRLIGEGPLRWLFERPRWARLSEDERRTRRLSAAM